MRPIPRTHSMLPARIPVERVERAARDETADWLLDDAERVGGFTVKGAINAGQPVAEVSPDAVVLVLVPLEKPEEPKPPINAAVTGQSS